VCRLYVYLRVFVCVCSEYPIKFHPEETNSIAEHILSLNIFYLFTNVSQKK